MFSEYDRTVHARSASGIELVRYDRAGRWYLEQGDVQVRVKTVHDAAEKAIAMERQGGEIYPGRPGGKQFDAKVTGAKEKRARHR